MGQSDSLLRLVQGGPEESIENLLLNEKSVNFEALDSEGRNPLHWAALEGRHKVVSLLVKHGPSDYLNSTDANGNTAMHMAAFNNQPQILSLLLSHGAAIDIQDRNGMTPLHWAVSEKHGECIKILLAAGASLEIKTDKGKNAIELAQNLRKNEQILPLFENHIPVQKPTLPVDPPTATTQGTPFWQAHSYEIEPNQKKAPSPPAATFIRMLACVCKLWGFVKYTHPFLAYRTDIDWENLLLLVLGKLLEIGENISPERFVETIAKMLEQLKDPNTYLDPHPMQTKATPTSPVDSKPQPHVKIIENVAYITLTDTIQLNNPSKLGPMKNAFSSACNSANLIIIDMRSIESDEALQFALNFETAIRSFIPQELLLPTKRKRLSALDPETCGMLTFDSTVLPACEDPSIEIVSKPMCFIVNRQTPTKIFHIICALQTQRLCSYVYQTEPEHVRSYTDGETLYYEPGIDTCEFDLGIGMVKIFVRETEYVNSDSTIGIYPDQIVVAGEETEAKPNTDIAIQTAVDLLLKPLKLAHKPKTKSYQPRKQISHPFVGISLPPPPPFRLLELFRVWNSVFQFASFDDHEALSQHLLEAIPLFIKITQPDEYQPAISEFLSKLKAKEDL